MLGRDSNTASKKKKKRYLFQTVHKLRVVFLFQYSIKISSFKRKFTSSGKLRIIYFSVDIDLGYNLLPLIRIRKVEVVD